VDTGASAEDLKSLKEDFKDYWAEQDSGTAETKEAPAPPDAPGPAQETKSTPVSEEGPKKVDEAKPVPAGEPIDLTVGKGYSDEDIDKMELHKGQSPEVYQQFKEVKDLWKADRAKWREQEKRAQTYEAQLNEARANQLTPEMKADYEHAAGVRRKFDFASDPEFVNKFHLPVIQQYQNILDEAASMLPDPEAGAQWAAFMKEKYSPDQLNRQWWLQSVVDKIPNELDRQQIMGQIADLSKLQKERNAEVHNRTSDAASFDAWIAEKTTNTAKRVQEEIMAEIGVQEGRIKEVLPVDIAQAKTREERAAMESHNERFAKLNQFFVDTVKDLSANGPRAWVRAAVEATRTQIMDQQIVNLEKELKEIKTERDRLKTEMEKITGARRKLSHTSGTPPTPTGGKTQNGQQGLSIKDLDVRKSFRQFDWGDNQ
jgi:hypothetical protein